MDFPKPSPNQEAYNKILNNGFKQFPQRLENYNKYLRILKPELFTFVAKLASQPA